MLVSACSNWVVELQKKNAHIRCSCSNIFPKLTRNMRVTCSTNTPAGHTNVPLNNHWFVGILSFVCPFALCSSWQRAAGDALHRRHARLQFERMDCEAFHNIQAKRPQLKRTDQVLLRYFSNKNHSLEDDRCRYRRHSIHSIGCTALRVPLCPCVDLSSKQFANIHRIVMFDDCTKTCVYLHIYTEWISCVTLDCPPNAHGYCLPVSNACTFETVM